MEKGMFNKFERDELNRITAKSILEKLMNIRQNINADFTARRLIWELMQNAKDNAGLCHEELQGVDIEIKLTESQFIFSHNKGFFTNEYIRCLIRKYSSSDKDRDADLPSLNSKPTGRFGTGFMTTHLLSEKVQIESYFKNDENSFQNFSFWLDRSGIGEKEIIKGIDNAFEEAEESILRSEKKMMKPNEFITSFKYPLTENKKKLAQTALNEVCCGIAYTLINVPAISSVTVESEAIERTVYKVMLKETITYQEHDYSVFNLIENDLITNKCFVTAQNEVVSIIIPISCPENIYRAEEIIPLIPRLHLDFPMVGTEDLNLPFVINSSFFEPTEPRDGISLMFDDNLISQLNCKLISSAVLLYEIFISYAGSDKRWNNLYNLARIRQPKKHSWLDSEWFKQNVVKPIQLKLMTTQLVDVVSGERIAILNPDNQDMVYFPSAEKENVREKLWELSQKLFPDSVPVKDHAGKWQEIIWGECRKFTIEDLSEVIENAVTLSGLGELLLADDEKDVLEYLDLYYDLLNFEKKHITEINADHYKVIPNQEGEFQKRSDLSLDNHIDEEIKNVYGMVSSNPRVFLRHNGINTASSYSEIESVLKYNVKKQEDFIREINSLFKENKVTDPYIACDYLVSLFPQEDFPEKRTQVFDFSKRIFPEDFNQKRRLEKYDEALWEESDKKSLFFVVSKVSESMTVEGACENFNFSSREEFIKWIDKIVSFLVNEGFDSNINKDKHPILPNQNGRFCLKDALFTDAGDIDEVLKDISTELGHDFREELLESQVYLELGENRQKSIEDVSEKISAFMKPLLRDVDLRKKYKDTLKKFYLWMDENRERAGKYFADLFEKKFLFLEDDDIASNIKKASDLDTLMAQYNIKNVSELQEQLAKIQGMETSQTEAPERTFLSVEVLARLGISSLEQLQDALKDPQISSRFYHTSIPTPEMFLHVQDLLKRAKDNVKEYLKKHPDYDCTDIEETAPTTFAGILKKGVPVQIVARPSDHGEVIIYYSSEKDTLDSDNSEFWVENGQSDPHILTLGRILKSTGINRIPINMN